MDPNTTYTEASELISEIDAAVAYVDRESVSGLERDLLDKWVALRERLFALDGWLTSGGFPPAVWAATDEGEGEGEGEDEGEDVVLIFADENGDLAYDVFTV